MGAEGVLLVGRTVADVRPHQDQRRPAPFPAWAARMARSTATQVIAIVNR